MVAPLQAAIATLGARLDASEKAREAVASQIDVIVAERVAQAVAGLPGPIAGPPGELGPAGRDGVGLAGAVIDRNGDLVLTMSNGDQRALGRIVGWDGKDGNPGQDGLGFDDLAAEYDGERTITIKFTRGDLVKSFSFEVPIALYRGVFRAGAAYTQGDCATFSGSLWIARRATDATPGASEDWQLAVRNGRDGKNGKDGAPGAQGPQGLPGRDGFRAA